MLRMVGMAFLMGLVVQGAAPAAETQPAKAGLVSGRPQGLFFMTRYWSYTQTLEKAAWYFTPSGEVYQNLAYGFAPQQLAAHQGPHGKLQLSGTRMKVTWADGKVSDSQIELDRTNANVFMWDMGSFIPATPIRSPQSLVGTYEGGESLDHGGNQAAMAKKLQLRGDGSFSLEGIGFVAGQMPGSVLYAGSEGGSQGTWQSGAYSITFRSNGGPTFTQIAFPVDDDSAALHPAHLLIGGMLYKKLSP